MDIMSLDKDRAGYLMDRIIIPSLKLDIVEPFYNFLEVLELEEDNVVVKVIAKDLRSLLGPPMPQPHGGQPYAPGQPPHYVPPPYAPGKSYGPGAR